ncbi:hypothetical protein F2P81_017553 [Scophthalmus maximus]|uniref:Uncharacterized protein n=1 Tax=Scophthalmus maximus TaxID=52904 RepID=A0A6A4SKC5_SCOMX|nr:hypothetical protein F2P81_017553 [Scophthalmus maximus]
MQGRSPPETLFPLPKLILSRITPKRSFRRKSYSRVDLIWSSAAVNWSFNNGPHDEHPAKVSRLMDPDCIQKQFSSVKSMKAERVVQRLNAANKAQKKKKKAFLRNETFEFRVAHSWCIESVGPVGPQIHEMERRQAATYFYISEHLHYEHDTGQLVQITVTSN